MFGLKRENVTKIYRRMFHIKFIHYTNYLLRLTSWMGIEQSWQMW